MSDYEERLEEARKNLKLAVYFVKQFTEVLGREKTLEIIEKAWSQYLIDNWKSRLEGVSPEDTLKAMGEWFKAQAWSYFKIVEATPKRLQIEYAKCPVYDACKELGVPEICQKYCDADYGAIPVMYPKIKLARDKEIAYGADRCNHCWIMEE